MDYGKIETFALRHAPSQPRRCLDLCCGTGTLTRRFGARSIETTGVDNSGAMLERARNAPSADRVRWAKLDVAREALPDGPFDLVVCTADSANYFSPQELDHVLSQVHRVLAPGGGFVFDINSEHRLRTFFGNTVYGETHEGWAYVWKNSLSEDEGLIRYDITLFLQKENGLYSRHHEQHCQFLHSLQQMQGRLTKHGFSGVTATDDYSEMPATPTTARISFACRRS
jgi:SAM-dependent methyltransferase